LLNPKPDEAALHAAAAAERAHARIEANAVNSYGETKLWKAASAGKLSEVRALLAADADPSTANTTEGKSPILIASMSGHLDVVKALIRAGADVNAPTHRGFTPLGTAIYFGRSAVAALLRENDARENAD
jgi:ankyrin repeat protein